jgi:hypothetical protein
LAGFLFLFAARPAEASHFRYGILTWELTGNAGEVEFSLVSAFRRTGYSSCVVSLPLTFGPCSGTDGRPATGDIILETVGATGLDFGDGSSGTGTLLFLVEAFDPTGNWIIGRALNPGTTTPGILHTYANTSTTYTAQASSCCRIGGLNNRSSASYRLATEVTFDGNTPPSSSLVPIVTVNEGSMAQFVVPAVDDDGDDIRFRLATEAESVGGGAEDQVPGLTIDPITGVVTWNNVGLNQSNFWTTQIIIEDLDASGNVKSMTPVDFLLRIQPVGANNQPVCDISPAGPFEVAPGDNVAFTVTGTDSDASDVVTINTGGLPAGATMSPSLPFSGASGVNSSFSWTPTAGQIDSYVVLFEISDTAGSQDLCSVEIIVEEPQGDTEAPVCGEIAWDFDGTDYFLASSATDNVGITSATVTRLTPNLEAFVGGIGPRFQGDVIPLPGDPTVDLRARLTSFSGSFAFLVTVEDAAGNTAACDPVVTEVAGALPEATALLPSYPNPARVGSGMAVTVPFSLAEATDVRVVVYDVLGREVAVLADGAMEAGSYEVSWSEAAGLPSGTYVVRLEAGAFARTQRLTLVR